MVKDPYLSKVQSELSSDQPGTPCNHMFPDGSSAFMSTNTEGIYECTLCGYTNIEEYDKTDALIEFWILTRQKELITQRYYEAKRRLQQLCDHVYCDGSSALLDHGISGVKICDLCLKYIDTRRPIE